MKFSYTLAATTGYSNFEMGSVYVRNSSTVGLFFAAYTGSALWQYYHYFKDGTAGIFKMGQNDSSPLSAQKWLFPVNYGTEQELLFCVETLDQS